MRPGRAASPRPSGFHELPLAVLARIFSYFSEKMVATRLAPVCRSWRQAAKDPRLWRHLSFRGSGLSTTTICRLLRTSPRLVTLHLDAVPDAATIVRQLCRCNVCIRSVAIRNCTFGREEVIQETVFRNLIVCCPQIVRLDLQGTQFNAFRFYQEIIHLPALTRLNVGDNRFLKVQDLMTLALNCKGLRELKVAKRPTREGTCQLTDTDAVYIFTHLKASLVSLKFDMAGLSDATLQAVLNCVHLKKLGLLNARQFSGDTLRFIGTRLPELASLKLCQACQMKPTHFCYLFSGVKSPLSHLTKLDLSGCWGLEDSGLQAVVDTCGSTLDTLSLKCCKTLTTDGLRHMVRHAGNLRRLNVAYAGPVDPSYFQEMPQSLPKLRKLVVDVAHRRTLNFAGLRSRMRQLAIFVSHSEYSADEIALRE